MVTETQTLTQPPTAESDGPGVLSGPLRLATVGLLIVVTLVAFEAMAVSTAMPTAMRDLGGLAHYGWAFCGFVVADILGIVMAGVLSDWRGPKPALLGGLVTFVAGLGLAGTAITMLQFVAGRVVQGLGAGFLVTAIYVIIGETYPEHLRPKVFAAMSSAWVLPGLVGPPLSGLLTQTVGWRWVFLALAPLGLVGALLMTPRLRAMPMHRRAGVSDAGRRRLGRAVGLALGVGVLLQAGQDPSVAWIGPVAVALAAVGWTLRGLLPAGTFSMRPGVPATIALRALLGAAIFGGEAFIPLSLSVQHGWNATLAGLPLVGSALAWSFSSWCQSRTSLARHRPALLRVGFGALTTGLAGAAAAAVPGLPGWLIYPGWLFAGLGAGLVSPTLSVLLLDQTTDADRANDSAALQLADGIATAVSIGVGGVLVAAAARAQLSYTTAFVVIDVSLIALTALGVVAGARART